jgi:hypothetical protein
LNFYVLLSTVNQIQRINLDYEEIGFPSLRATAKR